jgi:hypothetical protein
MFHEALSGRVAERNFLIAPGTHRPTSREHLDRLFGVSPGECGADRGIEGH